MLKRIQVRGQSAEESIRSKTPIELGPRWKLPSGACLGSRLDPTFLEDLRRYDSRLELVWHPGSSRWCLYRVKAYGACPAEDTLVLQWVIKDFKGGFIHPGPWLIEKMRKADRWQGGADPGKAGDAWLAALEAREEAVRESHFRRWEERVREASRRMFDKAVMRKIQVPVLSMGGAR